MIPILPYGIPAPLALPFVERVVAAVLRHKRVMLFIGGLILGAGLGGGYLVTRASEIQYFLYGPESQSIKALAFYEVGAYGRAAGLYREDYGRFLARENNAPAWVASILLRDYAGATRLAELELRTNPESVAGMLALAQVAYDRRDLETASHYIQRVLSRYWNNTDALLLAALVATRDPSKGDPILFLNKALRTGTAARNIMSFVNLLEMAGYLQTIGRTERPYAVLAQYYRALRIYDAGMTGRVIRAARRAISRGDHPSESFLTMGMMYEKSGRRPAALEAYNESVKINPKQALAYHYVSNLYAAQNFPQEYLHKKQAFRAAPADPFHLTVLDRFLMDKKEYYEAKQITEEAIRLNPDSLSAHASLASALLHLRDKQRARGVFERIMTLETAGPDELEQKAWAAEWLGREEEREALLRKSLAVDAGRDVPHKELARFYKKQGRAAEALKEFEIAFELGAYGSGEEIYDYCQLYQASGDAGRYQECMQAADAMNRKASFGPGRRS